MFCIGIAIGPFFVWISPPILFLFITLCLVALLLQFFSGKRRVILFLTIGCLFGIWRFLLVSIPILPADLPKLSAIEGIVTGDVERREDAQTIVIGSVLLNGIAWDGKLKLSMPLYPRTGHGDHLSFSCALRAPRPINGFRYDRSLASRGIAAECSFPSRLAVIPKTSFSVARRLLDVKEIFLDRLARVLPEPHASFVSGLLFGGSFAISPDMKRAFSTAGVSHILAASGFNVSLVTFVFLGFVTRRVGRSWGSAATVLLLFVYVFLAGAVASMVRAALMASLLLIGLWVRRKADQVNVLLTAGSLLLLWNPLLLLNDPGFQLSFGATAAILLIVPKWKSAVAFLPERFGIRETLNASLAIQLVTLPIVFWHFGSLSLISPLANVFILPFIPALFWSGLGTVVASAVSHWLGLMAAVVPMLLSMIILRFVQIFSTIPPVVISPFFSKTLAIAFFSCFLGYLLWRFKHLACQQKNTP